MGAHAPNSSDYEQYGYDAGSNVTSRRLRSGETINFGYDVLNRQTLMDLPSTTSADVYYAYDLLNRLLSARYASVSGDGVVYSYTTPGTVTETDTQASPDRTLISVFDTRGLRTRLTHPDANYFDYTYDVLGRPLQVRENGATSGAGLLASYSYDVLGRRAGIARAGGSGVATTYTYDTDSRDWSLAQNFSGSTYDITYSFTANAAAQALTRTPSNSTFDYTPPSSGTVGYTPNGLNQYGVVGGVSYSYDGRGNLTSDGARTFAYDLLNRLTSVSGSASMTLSYDPLGRLRQTVASSTTTQFLYDGHNLVVEYDGSNAIQRRYAQGIGIDAPLVWYEGAALTDRRWLVADDLGSAIAYANATGVAASTYTYSAFGEPAVWSGPRFRYTGQISLDNVSLYHYRARAYDPVMGRFLQTDPVGYSAGPNLYSYVRNDPINWVDPLGTQSRPADDDDEDDIVVWGRPRFYDINISTTPIQITDHAVEMGNADEEEESMARCERLYLGNDIVRLSQFGNNISGVVMTSGLLAAAAGLGAGPEGALPGLAFARAGGVGATISSFGMFVGGMLQGSGGGSYDAAEQGGYAVLFGFVTGPVLSAPTRNTVSGRRMRDFIDRGSIPAGIAAESIAAMDLGVGAEYTAECPGRR